MSYHLLLFNQFYCNQIKQDTGETINCYGFILASCEDGDGGDGSGDDDDDDDDHNNGDDDDENGDITNYNNDGDNDGNDRR